MLSVAVAEGAGWSRGAGAAAPPGAGAEPEYVAAYQRVRATVVEDRLDDMIEIVDHPDLDPLDKRGRIDHVARTRR
jgi:hypothetical protein